MALRPSRALDVARLIEDLTTGDRIQRESAAARLAVIGARAVPKLVEVARTRTLDESARACALGALSAIGDVRATGVAIEILESVGDSQLSLDAIDVLGSVVQRSEPQATAAFDSLAGLALNTNADVEHRLAAITALEGLPRRTLRPLYETLASDPASRVVARIVRKQAGAMLSLADLLDRGLPDDPGLVAAAVRDDTTGTRITTLRRAVDAVRQREAGSHDERAAVWRSVRGELHQALADRGSRIAIYDLRETIERARSALPVGFVSAVGVVGDETCLEAIAAAWLAAATGDRWWREHLADAFGAIVAREHIARRHRTLQKILKRWPAAGVLIARAKA